MRRTMRWVFGLLLASLLWGWSQEEPAREVKLYGTMVTLSDYGAEDLAYLSVPETPPIGGIVFIHDWWGINEAVKRMADRLSGEGFVVVAVDLFNGTVTEDPTQAAQLMKHLRPEVAMKAIKAGVQFLRESPKFKVPRVATYGWSMGGGLSLQAALKIEKMDAAVMYYGPVELNPEKLKRLKIPFCGVFARSDEEVPASNAEEFRNILMREKKPLDFRFFEAPHGFASLGDPRYNGITAAEAYAFTLGFLKREFSKPLRKEGFFENLF